MKLKLKANITPPSYDCVDGLGQSVKITTDEFYSLFQNLCRDYIVSTAVALDDEDVRNAVKKKNLVKIKLALEKLN